MLIFTCDGNESICWAEVRPLDDLPDPRYQADVEAVLGPALQKAHMHQRPPAPATPLWWMHRPPSLAHTSLPASRVWTNTVRQPNGLKLGRLGIEVPEAAWLALTQDAEGKWKGPKPARWHFG